MQENLISSIIRRSNRNLYLIGFGGLVIVIIGIALSASYLYNFFRGPFVLSHDEIINFEAGGLAPEPYYITVNGDEMFDSGYEYVEISDSGGEKRVASYGALALNDRLLLVKTADLIDESRTEYTGALVGMPADVQREVIDDIVKEVPELQDVFLPVMLDTENFYTPGYIGFAVGGVIVVVSLVVAFKASQRSADHTKHPIMKALSRYGDSEMVAEQIENERMIEVKSQGKLNHTRNWVMSHTSTTFEAARVKDLMWAYKQITQHRTNGIPTGKTFSALLWDRHGRCITVSGKEADIDVTLESLARRAPWLMFGYDQQLEAAWKGSRAEVIAAVDQRREQYQSQASSETR